MILRASNKPHTPNQKPMLPEAASRAAAKAEQAAHAQAGTDWIDEDEEKLEQAREESQEASQDDVATAEGSPAFTGAAIQVAEAAPVAASDAAPAAAGTVAAASAGVPPVLLAIGGIGLIAAASSGGGDTPASPQATFDGKAIDGYLAGATVFVDVDGDGQLDAGEPSDTTDADGDFTLPQVVGEIIAFGGTDIATGLDFTGVLKAPSGSTVVTPLTTLMAERMAEGEDAEAAQAAVLGALGLGDLEVDLTTLDPVAAAGEGDADALALHKAGVAVAALVVQVTEQARDAAGGGDREDIAGEVYALLAGQLAANALQGGNLGEAGGELLDALGEQDNIGGVALDAGARDALDNARAFVVETLNGLAENLAESEDLDDIGNAQKAAQDTTYRLQLLHFSDAEAGMLASQTAPNLAALLDAFEDDYANSITLAGGDNFIPGPFLAAGTDSSVRDEFNTVTGSSVSGTMNIAAVDIALHNAMGVEASALGNHDFDLGSNVLKTAITSTASYVGAQFPFISANLDFSRDTDLAGLYTDTTASAGLEQANALKGKIVPSAVLTENGARIGLVGATTQILESISSPSGTVVKDNDGVRADDMDLLAAQLQPVIDDLIAQGVNKIILMAHLQVIGNEKLLASKLSGVDIILSAGSNTRLGDADDTAVAFPGHAASFADTYPLVIQDKDGHDTLIVNTDNEFTYLGRLVVDFDANGHIVTESLAANAGINGAYAATAENVAEAWGVSTEQLATTAFADGTRGDAVQTLTDAVQEVITLKDGLVYGYSDVYLEGERIAVRNQETNLGDLSADANAHAAQLALGSAAATTFMVSIKNGGGIRAQIGTISAPDPVDGTVDKLPPEGGVSQLDVENSLRFNNQLMLFETTAEGLKAILEHGVASLGNQGRFPQLGGVAFSYDPDLPAGSRISDIALTGEGYTVNLYNDGVKLDSTPSNISLVTLNFLANGGDSYPMKANGSNFRYIMEGADGSFSLSAAVDEALNYTDAGVIATYVTGGNVLLGEQAAFEAYMQAFHATPETAYDQAETPEAEDARIQNLNVRAEDVLNPGEEMLLVGQIALPASEITAYHSDSKMAFVVGGGDEMYVVSLADPAHPELLQTIQLAGKAQSVAVNADGLVALAVSQLLPVAEGSAATYQGPGLVQFFQMSGTQLLAAGQVTVGALPDSLTFNDAGTILVTANEGEPNLFFTEAESKDPAGSISIINIDAATPANSMVTTLGFDAYNGKLEQLRDKGVRISGDDAADGITGNLVAQDMEPEYVSITGNTAYVSLQENNAIAVVNLDTRKITAINPVGLKDWTRGEAEATTAEFSLTYPGTRPDFDGNGQVDDGEVTAGGLSGLWYSGKETVNGVAYDVYYSITDRGPQAAAIGDREGDNPSDPAKGGKIFDDPDYPITVYKLGMADGEVVELGSTSLKVPDGAGGFRNATGLGMLDRSDAAYQLTGVDGEGFNTYELLGKDQFGLDTESILHLSIAGLNNGNPVFAIADEYGPQIALFDAASGNLIHRIMPANTDFAAAGGSITWPDLPAYTLETLPENYSSIINNRGFEAMAYNSSDGLLYAFVQSPLQPSGYKNQEVVRIIAVDPITGEAKHEYLYPLSGEKGQDKMGDAVYDAARDVFYVIERDSGVTANANKTIFEINLTGATDVLDYTQGSNGQSWTALIGVAQPELLTAASLADALAVHGIDFAHKNELLNIPSLGIDPRFDKAEGLALKPDGTLVVGFDNDFVHVDGRPDNLLAEIRFNPLDVDTSDKDGGINPGYRPFYGLRMPDGIDSYQYNGETFVVMANEGDGRVRPDVANYEVGDAQDDAYLKISATLADGVTPVATLEDAITGVNFHVLTTDAADPDAVQVAAGDEYFLTLKYGWQAPDFLYNDETRVKDYDDLTRLEQYVEDHAADLQRLKTVNTESYLSDAAAQAGAPEQLIGFGGRSFSIMDSKGNLVYDSGTLTERAAMLAGQYDDGRSDDKGTEPENVTLAEVNGTIYAYVGLERANSVVVFDVTNPYDVSFVQILPVSADTGFVSPEGLVAHDGLLIVSNEVTPGLAIYAHKDGLVSTYTPNTGTTGGSSDASTAFGLDSNYMIVADDEANLLRVYPRDGGAAVMEWSYAANGPMLAKELDLEAGAKVGNTLYLIGSHSNKKDGSDAEADRSHLFAVTVSGTGAETQFTYVGKFDQLESELIAWDVANTHGLGADYFGFAASAADGVSPERIDGFSIEGMATSPDHSALWLAFRAPQTTEARDHALIVPVTNYTALVAGTATDATFGAPIQLDLGGRGIRSISQAADGTYLIIAGPAGAATEAVDRDFVLFTWDGNIAHEAVELGNNLDALRDATGGSFESIVSMPNTPSTGDFVQLLMDNGDTVWEGETDISKDLPDAEQQFQGVWVKLQAACDDTAGPLLKSATPADGAVGADVNGDIVLTFNEGVARGEVNSGGNLVLHKADGTVVETFDMASSDRVTLNYNVVTVDPTAPLEYDTGYYVTLASGAIRDHAGNNHAGFNDATSLNFTASGVPTTLAAGDVLFVAGNAEATDAMAFVLLKAINGGTSITFTDRDYNATTGYAGITNEAAFVWTADQNYAAGTVVTIQTDVDGNPLADKGSTLGAGGGLGKSETYYAFQGGSIASLAEGAAGEITSVGTFLASLILGGAAGDIPAELTTAGSALSFTINPANQTNARYTGSLDAGDLAALATRIKDADNWEANYTKAPGFPLVDDSFFGAPLLSDAEVNGATLTLTWNQPLDAAHAPLAGAFAVTINGTPVNVNSVAISGDTVTLTLATAAIGGDTVALSYTDPSSGNDVHAIQLLNGSDAASLTSQSVLNLSPDSTPPTLSSSNIADEATGVATFADLVLTFNEAIAKGSGNITFKGLDGAAHVVVDVSAAAVTLSGNQATVNPTDLLAAGKQYAVQIDATAFTDVAGNAYAGIANDTHLNFTTSARPEYSLLITEMNSNASGGDFFELYNYGATAIDLSGWRMTDEAGVYSGAVAFPEGVSIAAGATLTVAMAETPDDLTAFKAAWGLGVDDQVIALNGPGLGKQDAVVVFDAAGYVAAAFNYDLTSVTASDGTDITTAAASAGVTFADGQHAGTAYNGGVAADKASAVWDGESFTAPAYKVAVAGQDGAYAQADAASIGSPGALPFGVVGDLVFLAANADATDAFAFQFMKAVAAGTEIVFTDRNYSEATGMPTSGESAYVWTADVDYAAGTFVSIQPDNANPVADHGTVVGAGGGISSSAETLYAFTGAVDGLGSGAAGALTVNTFLAAINVGGAAAGDIPASLAGVPGAYVSFSQEDVFYSGLAWQGPADTANFLAALENASQWNAGDSPAHQLVDGSLYGEPASLTPISTIQGVGSASAMLNSYVWVEAVVSAVTPGAGGFYLQEEAADSDGNDATSEGIFVYHGGNVPGITSANIGDTVRLYAQVAEYNGLTELKNLSNVQVVRDGNSVDVPTAVSLTLPVLDYALWEQYEGMLVEVRAASGDLTVTDNYNLGRYGSVTLSSGGILEQFTENSAPDVAAYSAYSAATQANQIILDDGSSAQNPDPEIFARAGADLSAGNTLRAGDTTPVIRGVLDQFATGAELAYETTYRVQATEDPLFSGAARPTAADLQTALGAAEIKVASVNVLNFFSTFGTADFTTPYGTAQSGRGADDAGEYQRQLDKLLDNLFGLDADVYGLMEIQNNGFAEGSALDALVDAMNARAGAEKYAYIAGPFDDGDGVDEPTAGDDAIMVALVYDSTAVAPLGQAAVPDADVYDAFGATYGNRVPVAQTFQSLTDGETFTVAVNHLKSKGSVLDADIGDGQGANNLARMQGVTDLAAWLATNPTGAPDGDILLIGDLNAYSMEDPVAYLAGNGYTKLNDGLSYSFDGLWGALDHALASASLASQVTSAVEWAINAEEPSVLDYNTNYKSVGQIADFYAADEYRSSDHNPLLIGLNLSGGAADTQAPELQAASANGDTIRLGYDENLKPGNLPAAERFSVSVNGGEGPAVVSIAVRGGELSLTLASPLAFGDSITLGYADPAGDDVDAIQDIAGNDAAALVGQAVANQTPVLDTTAPSLASSSPADDATGVAVGASLVLTFDEPMQKGTGAIVIRHAADSSMFESIDVASDQVSVSGAEVTLNPAANLALGSGYYVEMAAGVLTDAAGNAFAGLQGDAALNFSSQPGTPVFISELHYDNAGTDSNEAVAITGPAGTDLTGWSVVFYNGGVTANQPYATLNLSGSIDNENNSGYGELSFSQSGIQNGAPDALALVNAAGGLVQFLSYEGSFVGAGGVADGVASHDIGVFEAGTETAGLSLQLSGSGHVYESLLWNSPATATLGSLNPGLIV